MNSFDFTVRLIELRRSLGSTQDEWAHASRLVEAIKRDMYTEEEAGMMLMGFLSAADADWETIESAAYDIASYIVRHRPSQFRARPSHLAITRTDDLNTIAARTDTEMGPSGRPV